MCTIEPLMCSSRDLMRHKLGDAVGAYQALTGSFSPGVPVAATWSTTRRRQIDDAWWLEDKMRSARAVFGYASLRAVVPSRPSRLIRQPPPSRTAEWYSGSFRLRYKPVTGLKSLILDENRCEIVWRLRLKRNDNVCHYFHPLKKITLKKYLNFTWQHPFALGCAWGACRSNKQSIRIRERARDNWVRRGAQVRLFPRHVTMFITHFQPALRTVKRT